MIIPDLMAKALQSLFYVSMRRNESSVSSVESNCEAHCFSAVQFAFGATDAVAKGFRRNGNDGRLTKVQNNDPSAETMAKERCSFAVISALITVQSFARYYTTSQNEKKKESEGVEEDDKHFTAMSQSIHSLIPPENVFCNIRNYCPHFSPLALMRHLKKNSS